MNTITLLFFLSLVPIWLVFAYYSFSIWLLLYEQRADSLYALTTGVAFSTRIISGYVEGLHKAAALEFLYPRKKLLLFAGPATFDNISSAMNLQYKLPV